MSQKNNGERHSGREYFDKATQTILDQVEARTAAAAQAVKTEQERLAEVRSFCNELGVIRGELQTLQMGQANTAARVGEIAHSIEVVERFVRMRERDGGRAIQDALTGVRDLIQDVGQQIVRLNRSYTESQAANEQMQRAIELLVAQLRLMSGKQEQVIES